MTHSTGGNPMKSRKLIGVAVTIVLIGAFCALWGSRGLAVYLVIKVVALALLGLLWTARRRLAARNR